MNKILSTAVAALLLSACNKPVPEPAEPVANPAATVAPAPAAETAAPIATTDAPEPAAAPAADTAGDKAIDDRIDAVLGDHTQYRTAFAQLQQAVAAKDAAAVAALVGYPLNATIDGKKTAIKNAEAFVAQYDKIVTPAIADVIVKQKYAELMVNAQGVMFGSGQAWLNGVCKDKACKAFDVKIVALQPGA